VSHAPRHFSVLARRLSEPPISWLMHAALARRNLISLAAGFTDNETLPVDEVAALMRKIPRDALQYGTTIGLPELRQELVRRWQKQDGADRFAPDDVIVTNGSQQLLYLITEALCDPGDIVIVEDPTYFVYLGILEAMGVRAMTLDTVPRRLLPRVKLAYFVTYFQNPTGHTWPLDAKREALAKIKRMERAAGHPIQIVEDAAYRDLRFEGEDVPSFKSLDARVAYTNTLTKPFATGLKIGYGILPAPLMRAVLRIKGNHDFGTSNLLQFILARALAEGLYDRHLPKIAKAYRRKRDVMVTELRTRIPIALYEVPAGGLYVWAKLPAHIKTGVKSRLFKRALDAGVLYVPGEMCFRRDAARPVPQNCLRLSFGAARIEQIKKGIRLLADALS
jgi:2-aminoadipate transaminase